MVLPPLPPSFSATREAARALACFVLAPARLTGDGHIGLRATGDGFGTPTFGERSRRVVIRRNHLVVEERGSVVTRAPITTLRAAAQVAGVELAADPAVGKDTPPFRPDEPLDVDGDAVDVLAEWYALTDMALVDVREDLVRRGTASAINLWPEHFDLAFDWGPDAERRVNLGGSPGDATSDEPYLYVGPWGFAGSPDEFWNAPFGATLPYAALVGVADPTATAVAFFAEGTARLAL